MHGSLAATYAHTQPPYSLIKLTMRGALGDRGPTIAMSAEAFRRAIPALMRTSGDEVASFCQTLLAKLLQRLRATARLPSTTAWCPRLKGAAGMTLAAYELSFQFPSLDERRSLLVQA